MQGRSVRQTANRQPLAPLLASAVASRLMIDGRLRVVGRAGGFGEEDEEVLESFLGIVATIVKSSFVFESLGKDVVSEAAAVFSQGPAHLQRRPSVSRYLHTPTPSDRWCSGLPGWGAVVGGG